VKYDEHSSEVGGDIPSLPDSENASDMMRKMYQSCISFLCIGRRPSSENV